MGTEEWFVIHHCGLEFFTDEIIRGLLASSLETASIDASGWHDHGQPVPGVPQGGLHRLAHHPGPGGERPEDVERIRNHPLVPRSMPLHAYIYQVESGRIVEVPGASSR